MREVGQNNNTKEQKPVAGLRTNKFLTEYHFDQGCEAIIKMTQLWLQSSSFHEHGSDSSSGALGFHDCDSSSRALFFHVSSFCSFSHMNMLIVLVCLKLNRK